MSKEKASALFIPQPTVPAFPKDEHGDVFISKHKHDYNYEDSSFKFRPKNFWFRIKRFFVRIFGLLIGETVVLVSYGLKVKGRKNLHKHKAELKNGYITISNHVFSLDCLGVSAANFGHFPEYPMWKDGFESSLGKLLQAYGGFPVVRTVRSLPKAYTCMKEVVNEKRWLQVYPEAACWFFYVPIREFEVGTFRLAYETGAPVIPLGFSFRPRHGIYKLWNRKEPLVTITVGEPLYANKELSREEASKELRDRAHLAVIHLCGIKDETENEELKKRYSYTDHLVTNIKK
jgi:1-acyl-sn-glycerol-3-phosphate acyltransferase